MADESTRTLQLFVRLLDGKSTTINFASPSAYGHQIKHRIFEKTKIPTHLQRLICGGYQISDGAEVSIPESTVNLVLSLRGGKGGFGSLLRTQAGAKKTNNFDACRDMSGRRLRHVNAEKKLEEWKAGEEERKLERLAQEFLKKQATKVKQGVGNGATMKYVNKYKEDSDKCIEAVELALKESFQNGKRKGKMIAADSEKSKRLKIWKGKRAVVDSESDDESSDEEEDEKSIVLDNGSQVFADNVSSGTIMNETENGGSSSKALSESCSEEEKDIVAVHKSSEISMTEDHSSEAMLNQTEKKENLVEEEEGEKNTVLINNEDVKECSDSSTKTDFPVEADSAHAGLDKSYEPLNFDNFSLASDMEVLGMERLKNELQNKGMKCGGTLKERAERLFLLKSTPLDKIPKKLMAAKK